MNDDFLRHPDFEKLPQLRKSKFEIFMLKSFLKLSMLTCEIILLEIIKEIIFDKILNIFNFGCGAYGVSDIDKDPEEFELILDEFGKDIINLFVGLDDSD